MEGKTLTEILPEMAAEAERCPGAWWLAFERKTAAQIKYQQLSRVCDMRPDSRTLYRRKPKMVERTISYPEPLSDKPQEDDRLFLASAITPEFYYPIRYGIQPGHDKTAFERGLLHSTKEAAIEHGRQLAGIDDD